MNLCDINIIKEILKKYNFNFTKALGQNFLTEQWVPLEIAENCGASSDDLVIEIGPGMGCLTQALSYTAKKVIALELDRDLFPVLNETLSDCKNIEIIHGDVLKFDFSKLIENESNKNMDIYACANLPYYITTPAIAALLDSKCFKQITIMVQKEVAHRICSKPGGKDYSAFSIYVNYHAETEILFDVQADCFIPKPKVDSCVISIKPRQCPRVSLLNQDMFFSVVKASFAQRRKTLLNALFSGFSGKINKETLEEIIRDCGHDVRIRGERLSIEEFAKISDKIYEILK